MSDVAFDGQSYYCTLCFKAGFRSESQAHGHLGVCPVRRGYSSTPSTPTPKILPHMTPTPGTPTPTLYKDGLLDRVSHLEKSVYNELTHSKMVQNDWGRILIWVGLGVIIGIFVSNSFQDKGRVKKIGDKAVDKLTTKAIDKALGRMF